MYIKSGLSINFRVWWGSTWLVNYVRDVSDTPGVGGPVGECCLLSLSSTQFDSIRFDSIQFNSIQFNSIGSDGLTAIFSIGRKIDVLLVTVNVQSSVRVLGKLLVRCNCLKVPNFTFAYAGVDFWSCSFYLIWFFAMAFKGPVITPRFIKVYSVIIQNIQ